MKQQHIINNEVSRHNRAEPVEQDNIDNESNENKVPIKLQKYQKCREIMRRIRDIKQPRILIDDDGNDIRYLDVYPVSKEDFLEKKKQIMRVYRERLKNNSHPIDYDKCYLCKYCDVEYHKFDGHIRSDEHKSNRSLMKVRVEPV